MRADHAMRHNAAVGALVGLAVADALVQTNHRPALIAGGAVRLAPWGPVAARSFEQAELLLGNEPIDMGIGATDIVGVAIGLTNPDASPPLLADPEAVLMCSLIRDALSAPFDVTACGASGECERAIEIVRRSSDYADALATAAAIEASAPIYALVGTFAGLRWGPASIPATWATGVHGPVGARTYQLRQLRRLAERLMGFDAPMPPEPRRSLGPREVAPKLWLANLHAVPRFVSEHPDGAVISLCPTTGAFDAHPVRREFCLHDASGRTVNPDLPRIVDAVLGTIAAFHDEGRDVLVHCHHGASRTGLILRAWLLQELDLSVDDATTEAQVRWPKTSTWNQAFNREIERRATC